MTYFQLIVNLTMLEKVDALKERKIPFGLISFTFIIILLYLSSFLFKSIVLFHLLAYTEIIEEEKIVYDNMTLEEQKEVAINRYVDLMRIKAHETGENRELDYQIKVAKVKLSSFGIDYSELDF